jgi:hypothetical protein
VTARQLNRATLQRQLLLRREPLTVVDGVRRAVALQAQEPASPYLALWNRLADFHAGDLDAAYADHTVVKASLLRITLHAVAADDHPPFHHAMVTTLRAARLNDRRFRDTGLTIADADGLVDGLLELTAVPRSKAEVEQWVAEQLGAPAPRAWWALRTYAPLVHAPTGGPWSHRTAAAYRAAPAPALDGDRVPSLMHLVRRYLEGFGPATPQDIGQFTMLRQPEIRAGLDALADDLVTVEGPGRTLHDLAALDVPDADTPAPPRLLGMWDNTLLAYAERRRIIPDDVRAHVIRRNGDVLATVLVDGLVAGARRAVDGVIEVAAFDRLTDDAWAGIEAEARALRSFLADRDPQVFRRYGRWWEALPKAVVRRL